MLLIFFVLVRLGAGTLADAADDFARVPPFGARGEDYLR